MLLGLCRDIFQWNGITFMAQRKRAGLSVAAQSFQHLQELDVGNMCSFNDVSLHGLESAVFRDAEFHGTVWLDKCKCAPSGMLLGSCHRSAGLRYGSLAVTPFIFALLQGSMVPGRP